MYYFYYHKALKMLEAKYWDIDFTPAGSGEV